MIVTSILACRLVSTELKLRKLKALLKEQPEDISMTIRYDLAMQDHTYLWSTYAPAQDMSGAYVDQDDLAAMLKNPTKTQAAKCLEQQMEYWFQIGPDCQDDTWKTDGFVRSIAERHGFETTLLQEQK